MSFGPLGMIGSAAGASLAQIKGSDIEKGQHATGHHERVTHADEKAEQAAGIGETTQDEQASDRDADGRRPWEIGGDDAEPRAAESGDCRPTASRDATGTRGTKLDLSG